MRHVVKHFKKHSKTELLLTALAENVQQLITSVRLFPLYLFNRMTLKVKVSVCDWVMTLARPGFIVDVTGQGQGLKLSIYSQP